MQLDDGSTANSYNRYGQMTRLTEGNRTVDYGYDSDGNLTSVTRNGFRYDYTYDGFGNPVDTKIAGKTVSANSYAPNNGTHTGTTYADGSRTSQDRDAYGRVIRSYITDAGGTRHQIDATVYDNDGNVKKYTDTANSLTTEYDYDDAGRVARSTVKKENSSAYNGSRVQYSYSKGGKIENLSYDTGDGKINSYVYTYAKDGLPEKSVFPDSSYQTLSYDSLRRNNEKVYYPVKNAVTAKRLYTAATFMDGQSSASTHKGTTALIKTYTNKLGTTNKTSEFTYAYDEWGNITGITDLNGKKNTYAYNEYGELTKAAETYTKGTYTYDYTYDSGENIKTEKVAGPSGTATHTYAYDSVWKDKLISYDGKGITYDAMGNPTNYMGASMTWDVKGNLTCVSGRNGKSAAYTYLSDGQRYTKTTGGKTTAYLYNNGLLLSETTGNEVINYYYDSDGTVLGIGYKKGTNDEKHYFFEKNAFGDVIAVYRNSDSVLIGTYEYDLWGNPVSVKEAAGGRDTDGILGKNPFRYRCYYYDTETGFYYLNARYYDPQTRRFISADDRVLQTGENAKGYNLYSYCQNMPVGMADYNGHSMTLTLTLALPAIGAALSTVAAPVAAGAAIGITAAVTFHNVVKFKELVDAGINALEEEGKKRRNSIYTVYALSDSEGVRYVGRTKNYETRMRAHRKSFDKKDLKDNKLGENLTYEEARGLEQTAMLYYHTLKTAKGLNKINGISPKNKLANIYMEEAKGVAGYITNQISNEILDWMDK